MMSAQDNLKTGTVLQRTDLKGAPGWEAILVERILPPGAESGKHTQGGNEIVYIQECSVTFEAQGKPAVTLKPGEAFTTAAGEVHNGFSAKTAGRRKNTSGSASKLDSGKGAGSFTLIESLPSTRFPPFHVVRLRHGTRGSVSFSTRSP